MILIMCLINIKSWEMYQNTKIGHRKHHNRCYGEIAHRGMRKKP